MRGMGDTRRKKEIHTKFWFLENQKERGCVEDLGTEWRKLFIFFFFFCDPAIQRYIASSFLRFLDQTQRHTTVGRTPLDE
jgi:hypothetical protein